VLQQTTHQHHRLQHQHRNHSNQLNAQQRNAQQQRMRRRVTPSARSVRSDRRKPLRRRRRSRPPYPQSQSNLYLLSPLRRTTPRRVRVQARSRQPRTETPPQFVQEVHLRMLPRRLPKIPDRPPWTLRHHCLMAIRELLYRRHLPLAQTVLSIHHTTRALAQHPQYSPRVLPLRSGHLRQSRMRAL